MFNVFKKSYFKIILLLLTALLLFYGYNNYNNRTVLDSKVISSIQESYSDRLVASKIPSDQELKVMLLSNNADKIIKANNIIKGFTPEHSAVFLPEMMESLNFESKSNNLFSYRNIINTSSYGFDYIKDFSINSKPTKNQMLVIASYLSNLKDVYVSDIAKIVKKNHNNEYLYRTIPLGIVSNKDFSYQSKKLLVDILLKSKFKNSSNIIVATQIYKTFNNDIYNAYIEGLKGNDFSATHQNIGNNIIRYSSTMSVEQKKELAKALIDNVDMSRYSKTPVMSDRYPDYPLLALADLSPKSIPREAIELAEYFTSEEYNPKKKNYKRVVVPSAIMLLKIGRNDDYLKEILNNFLIKNGSQDYSVVWAFKYLRSDISKVIDIIHNYKYRDNLVDAIFTKKTPFGYEIIIFSEDEEKKLEVLLSDN